MYLCAFVLTYHFVNRLDNLQHLIVAYLAIPINVVKLKRPVQLILHPASARNAEGANEFFEVDAARLIRIEHIEDVVGKGARIAKGEELSVDFLEFLFA